MRAIVAKINELPSCGSLDIAKATYKQAIISLKSKVRLTKPLQMPFKDIVSTESNQKHGAEK